jgi:hypothetical protein
MKLKDSTVKLEGVQWQVFHAAVIVESVLQSFGTELVITSCNDGKHMPNSRHYKGLAFDARSRDLAPAFQVHARDEMKKRLGPDYDVVLEKDHFHIEHDPKVTA